MPARNMPAKYEFQWNQARKRMASNSLLANPLTCASRAFLQDASGRDMVVYKTGPFVLGGATGPLQHEPRMSGPAPQKDSPHVRVTIAKSDSTRTIN